MSHLVVATTKLKVDGNMDYVADTLDRLSKAWHVFAASFEDLQCEFSYSVNEVRDRDPETGALLNPKRRGRKPRFPKAEISQGE